MRVVLASKSPRRREILSSLGVCFDIVSADADESSDITDPAALVQELALRKGRATRELLKARGEWDDNTLVIASDTVVCADGEILGKPRDEEDAKRMLRKLSGRRHEVISGVCLIGPQKTACAHEVTEVEFDELDEETLDRYVKEAEPYDKAGAYAIQGMASAYIRGIRGCYFNVVGLPVHRLCRLYEETFGKKFL